MPPPGPSGFPGSQAAHPHARAPPPTPSPAPPPGDAPPGDYYKHDTGLTGTTRTTQRGRAIAPRLPYFGRSDAIAAFTRLDERQPVLCASKVPISVDAAGCLSGHTRAAPPSKRRGP